MPAPKPRPGWTLPPIPRAKLTSNWHQRFRAAFEGIVAELKGRKLTQEEWQSLRDTLKDVWTTYQIDMVRKRGPTRKQVLATARKLHKASKQLLEALENLDDMTAIEISFHSRVLSWRFGSHKPRNQVVGDTTRLQAIRDAAARLLKEPDAGYSRFHFDYGHSIFDTSVSPLETAIGALIWQLYEDFDLNLSAYQWDNEPRGNLLDIAELLAEWLGAADLADGTLANICNRALVTVQRELGKRTAPPRKPKRGRSTL